MGYHTRLALQHIAARGPMQRYLARTAHDIAGEELPSPRIIVARKRAPAVRPPRKLTNTETLLVGLVALLAAGR